MESSDLMRSLELICPPLAVRVRLRSIRSSRPQRDDVQTTGTAEVCPGGDHFFPFPVKQLESEPVEQGEDLTGGILVATAVAIPALEIDCPENVDLGWFKKLILANLLVGSSNDPNYVPSDNGCRQRSQSKHHYSLAPPEVRERILASIESTSQETH
jgi:hypothetical protein